MLKFDIPIYLAMAEQHIITAQTDDELKSLIIEKVKEKLKESGKHKVDANNLVVKSMGQPRTAADDTSDTDEELIKDVQDALELAEKSEESEKEESDKDEEDAKEIEEIIDSQKEEKGEKKEEEKGDDLLKDLQNALEVAEKSKGTKDEEPEETDEEKEETEPEEPEETDESDEENEHFKAIGESVKRLKEIDKKIYENHSKKEQEKPKEELKETGSEQPTFSQQAQKELNKSSYALVNKTVDMVMLLLNKSYSNSKKASIEIDDYTLGKYVKIARYLVAKEGWQYLEHGKKGDIYVYKKKSVDGKEYEISRVEQDTEPGTNVKPDSERLKEFDDAEEKRKKELKEQAPQTEEKKPEAPAEAKPAQPKPAEKPQAEQAKPKEKKKHPSWFEEKNPLDSSKPDFEDRMTKKGFNRKHVDEFKDDTVLIDVKTGIEYKYSDLKDDIKEELNKINEEKGVWHTPPENEPEPKKEAPAQATPVQQPPANTQTAPVSTPTAPAEQPPANTQTAPVSTPTQQQTAPTPTVTAPVPATPTEPVKPTEPAKPAEPVKSPEPVKPTEPAKPMEPVKSPEPPKPEKPTEPVKSPEPPKPEKPTEPEKSPLSNEELIKERQNQIKSEDYSNEGAKLLDMKMAEVPEMGEFWNTYISMAKKDKNEIRNKCTVDKGSPQDTAQNLIKHFKEDKEKKQRNRTKGEDMEGTEYRSLNKHLEEEDAPANKFKNFKKWFEKLPPSKKKEIYAQLGDKEGKDRWIQMMALYDDAIGNKKASEILDRISGLSIVTKIANKIFDEEELATRLSYEFVARKDKDLMSDTGGISKGMQREPEQKPPREDCKKRWRPRHLTKEQKDPDINKDPDIRKD